MNLSFCKRKTKKTKNFFDYPARERKRIIKKATEEANEKQLDLVKKYETSFM